MKAKGGLEEVATIDLGEEFSDPKPLFFVACSTASFPDVVAVVARANQWHCSVVTSAIHRFLSCQPPDKLGFAC